jgi:hypothetical protein
MSDARIFCDHLDRRVIQTKYVPRPKIGFIFDLNYEFYKYCSIKINYNDVLATKLMMQSM